MSEYKVLNKKGDTIFESDDIEECLDFCRNKPPPIKVFKGDVLMAYKSGSGPKRGRPPRKLEEPADEEQ